jgi:hypothetical protein
MPNKKPLLKQSSKSTVIKVKESKLLFATILSVLLTAAVALPPHSILAQTGASGAISSAQNMLNTCYEAAKEAEAAGANITALQDTLNTAGLLLSKAELAISQSDFASANSYAQQAQSTLSNFVSEANSLKDTASQQVQMSFLINVVGSIAGTFAVIGGSIALWIFLKKGTPKSWRQR